jgi:Ca-activated chloride channel family protein
MTFIWPSMLFSLLLLPVVVLAYVRLQGRQRALANSFYAFGAQAARRPTPGFRRHVPPIIFLLSLAVLLVALARPQAQVNLPRIEGTVMLVLDVSASMGATDVEPSRLEAAKAAARDFVLSQPSTVQIGVVSFSGSGFTVQAPTNDADALLKTIERLQPTSGTSLGQGIVTALYAIAVDAGLITEDPAASSTQGNDPAASPTAAPGDQPAGPRQENLLARLPEGAYPASVIVLLTDGEHNQSIDPVDAAVAAAEHEVPVHALGFGTPAGATLEIDGFNVHTALDEGTLQQITGAAGGEYFAAQGDQDPKQVYAKLTPQLVVKPEDMELTSVLAGAGMLMLLVGSLLSMAWFNRLP